MITEIENKIITKLETGGLSVRDVSIKAGTAGIVYPAIFVSTETGDYNRITQTKYRCELTIVLVAIFKNYKSEKDRRHGVYPILQGIINLLLLQDLDLEILPIIPKNFRNVTDDTLADKGLIAYQIELNTSYIIEKTDDEEDINLLRIGLEYYLQDPEDDDVLDAQDIVELGT
jgi:hypothetical protein